MNAAMICPDDLRTNRDLYLFIAELCKQPTARTLEDYLKALWLLGLREREREDLPLPRFAALLQEALHAEAPPFDPQWVGRYRLVPAEVPAVGHARWEEVILRQIVDLHEMQADGLLDNELRGFGIDAPRGLRWYNFDPGSFLECGVAGTFDGWEPDDPTDRGYVPGPVAVLDEQGQLTTADPHDLATPVTELGAISWDTFADFLGAGQQYE